LRVRDLHRMGTNWLTHQPDLSPPYRTQGKIVHRPWFSPEEYEQLYAATREYAKVVRIQDRWGAEQVHDFVLFMANTGLRPDEAKNLQHHDVKVVNEEATGARILEIEVRGKRGVGFCKSMPGAVQPYERLLKRAKADSDIWLKDIPDRDKKAPIYPEQTDPLFPSNHIKLFNGVLRRSKLKLDREGNKRTAYSLRHTYICMRLIEGADIYPLAKNCRTSVEMIQKFYAAHIKDLLDASAINVMRPKRPKKRPSDSPDKDMR
jgi:integrase